MELALLMEIHESTFGHNLCCGLQENLGSGQASPLFVGSDYFCESGCPGQVSSSTFYMHRLSVGWWVVWSNSLVPRLSTQPSRVESLGTRLCGAIEGGCCRAPGLPWFHKILSTPTSDYIELRVCCDQDTNEEDVFVGLYEIYVKKCIACRSV